METRFARWMDNREPELRVEACGSYEAQLPLQHLVRQGCQNGPTLQESRLSERLRASRTTITLASTDGLHAGPTIRPPAPPVDHIKAEGPLVSKASAVGARCLFCFVREGSATVHVWCLASLEAVTKSKPLDMYEYILTTEACSSLRVKVRMTV